MSFFAGKVAVITGASSGIGREIARLGAARGMRLVLADLSIHKLNEVAHDLVVDKIIPTKEIITCQIDVSKATEVQKLRDITEKAFGAPNYVFNNAGVAGSSGLIWENTEADWEWILGANLWSVVHGIRTFTPIMLQEAAVNSDYRGRIINTASMAGFSSMPLGGMYNVTKHGVVTLSETLSHDLNLVTDQVKASVLCPFFIPTSIGSTESGHRDEDVLTPSQQIGHLSTMKAVASGKISAEVVAQQTLDGVEKGDFYIFTHPGALASAKERIESVINGEQPSDPYKWKPEIAVKLKSAIQKAYKLQ